MDTFFGIPAHPLLVHVPVVLLPLSAIGVLLLVIRRSWYDTYRWVVLALAGLGALGGILAAQSGESLEEKLSGEDRQLIESHTQMGDTARLVGIIYFLLVLAWVLIPIVLERRAAKSGAAASSEAPAKSGAPTWLRPVLSALVVLAAIGSVWTVIDAGHSGAKRAWGDVGQEGG